MSVDLTEVTEEEGAREALRVLLVEDQIGDARLIQAHLRKGMAYFVGSPQVEWVQSLTEAFEALDEGEFEVVLLDLGLPESRGLETLRRMLLDVRGLPVVVLTGQEDMRLGIDALNMGAQDFVQKNELEGERLGRAIRFAMERHQSKLRSRMIEEASFALMAVACRATGWWPMMCNRACEALLGYDLQDWRRQGLEGVLGEDVARGVKDIPASWPRRIGMEARTRRKDGGLFWSRIEVIPLLDEQGVRTHLLFSFLDVSEEVKTRSQMMDMSRASVLKTVAQGVAHEINNPLAFVAANIEFALHSAGVNTAELREALEDALEGANRIKTVVYDLQKLSGSAKEMEVEGEKFDVKEVIEGALVITRNHISERAQLVVEIEEGIELEGNESRLGQALIHILLNASLAIEPNQRFENEVRVEARRKGKTVEIAIRDTGVGMSPEEQALIFEPFYTTRRVQSGSGLGLPIAKQIIQYHRGTIEVESVEGEGTTVRVILPVASEG